MYTTKSRRTRLTLHALRSLILSQSTYDHDHNQHMIPSSIPLTKSTNTMCTTHQQSPTSSNKLIHGDTHIGCLAAERTKFTWPRGHKRPTHVGMFILSCTMNKTENSCLFHSLLLTLLYESSDESFSCFMISSFKILEKHVLNLYTFSSVAAAM